MTHCKRGHEMSPQPTVSSFSITQVSLGSPLQFEPALGTQELDDLIDAYIPGPAPIQQKRAQVSLDFFTTVEASFLPGPISRLYHVHHHVPSQSSSAVDRRSNRKSEHSTSSAIPEVSESRGPAKRARKSTTHQSAESKRLPGFSIMTRDGVDITEYASRGPKTKEQRKHAALMRKIGSCPACKKSKQKCDPSHHRPAASPRLATSSAISPASSGVPSYTWSSTSSQSSASPHSSALETRVIFTNGRMSPISIPQTPEQSVSTLAFKSAPETLDPTLPLLADADTGDTSWLNDSEFEDFTSFDWTANFDDLYESSLSQEPLLSSRLYQTSLEQEPLLSDGLYLPSHTQEPLISGRLNHTAFSRQLLFTDGLYEVSVSQKPLLLQDICRHSSSQNTQPSVTAPDFPNATRVIIHQTSQIDIAAPLIRPKNSSARSAEASTSFNRQSHVSDVSVHVDSREPLPDFLLKTSRTSQTTSPVTTSSRNRIVHQPFGHLGNILTQISLLHHILPIFCRMYLSLKEVEESLDFMDHGPDLGKTGSFHPGVSSLTTMIVV